MENKIRKLSRSGLRCWSKFGWAILLLAIIYTYYLWYHVLVARGFGYLYNAMKYQPMFRLGRVVLLIALVSGLINYELIRSSLHRIWRIGYLSIITLGIAHFVVHWIVVSFGPTPFWHH